MKAIWPLFTTLQVMAVYSLLTVKVPSNVILMQDAYNNLIHMHFIPKEVFMEKLFGLVPSLEVLDDDSNISIYAKDSLGVGNPNMVLNTCVVMLPLICCIIFAMICLFLAARAKMPNCAHVIFTKIHSKIMWNSVLRYLNQTYLTFAIGCALAYKA